jgi:hypothetical protein
MRVERTGSKSKKVPKYRKFEKRIVMKIPYKSRSSKRIDQKLHTKKWRASSKRKIIQPTYKRKEIDQKTKQMKNEFGNEKQTNEERKLPLGMFGRERSLKLQSKDRVKMVN